MSLYEEIDKLETDPPPLSPCCGAPVYIRVEKEQDYPGSYVWKYEIPTCSDCGQYIEDYDV